MTKIAVIVGSISTSMNLTLTVYGANGSKIDSIQIKGGSTQKLEKAVDNELEIAAASYERQVDELVADDEETRDYVSALEDRYDNDGGDPFDDEESLVDEVERFLREQPE